MIARLASRRFGIGSTLLPDMQKRGYKQPMTLGPIMASGGLAVMIPPSGLAVLLGVIGEISVGQMLVAIVIPGFLRSPSSIISSIATT